MEETKQIISKLHSLLIKYKEKNEKQQRNLSRWLISLTDYALREDKDNKKNFYSFPRGSVIKVDFGFNVGYELGGVHFAIVISNDSPRSGNLTVVPLTSNKGKKNLHHSKIDLGTSLYDNVNHLFELYSREVFIMKQNFGETDEYHRLAGISKRYTKEINLMKKGSIANVNQLTTISKMRILAPRFKDDFLAGVTIEDEYLEQIDIKIRDLFLGE